MKKNNNANNPVQKLLPRNNVYQILNETSSDEIIYIVAPYGCGKTMAVQSWLKFNNINSVWISLCESDCTPERFWSLIKDTEPCLASNNKILVIDNFGYIKDGLLLREIKNW